MLIHINPHFLDRVWPEVEPLLAQAIAKNKGECDISQLRAQIAYGGAQLLVWQKDSSVGSVVVVEFKQYPNFRAAHISYMAGAFSDDLVQSFNDWARNSGASNIECLCGEGEERLFQKYGMHTEYRMMRAAL